MDGKAKPHRFTPWRRLLNEKTLSYQAIDIGVFLTVFSIIASIYTSYFFYQKSLQDTTVVDAVNAIPSKIAAEISKSAPSLQTSSPSLSPQAAKTSPDPTTSPQKPPTTTPPITAPLASIATPTVPSVLKTQLEAYFQNELAQRHLNQRFPDIRLTLEGDPSAWEMGRGIAICEIWARVDGNNGRGAVNRDHFRGEYGFKGIGKDELRTRACLAIIDRIIGLIELQ